MTATHDTTMSCNEVRDSLGAFALGALDAPEDSAIGTHLDSCPACRAEQERQDAVATDLLLAAGHVAPSSELRARLMAEVEDARSPSAQISMGAKSPRGKVITFQRWQLAGIAAALILLVGGSIALGFGWQKADDGRDTAEQRASTLAAYVSAGGAITPLRAQAAGLYDTGEGRGVLLMAPGKTPLIVVDGCPPTNDDRHYRVWLALDGDRSPVGELEIGENGQGQLAVDVDQPLASFDQLGVTMLDGSGSRQDVLIGILSTAG